MKTMHLIHGIHTSEGDTSTPEYLLPLLRNGGHKVKVHEYGYVLAVLTRFQNPGRAAKIAPYIADGDVIIAHSNGADITRIMVNDLGVRPSQVILLQPALDKDTNFNRVPRVDVCWNKEDKAVFFAKLLPFHHPFGEMGRTGYVGSAMNTVNHDTLKICGIGGHSAPYQKSQVMRDYVVGLIR